MGDCVRVCSGEKIDGEKFCQKEHPVDGQLYWNFPDYFEHLLNRISRSRKKLVRRAQKATCSSRKYVVQFCTNFEFIETDLLRRSVDVRLRLPPESRATARVLQEDDLSNQARKFC